MGGFTTTGCHYNRLPLQQAATTTGCTVTESTTGYTIIEFPTACSYAACCNVADVVQPVVVKREAAVVPPVVV